MCVSLGILIQSWKRERGYELEDRRDTREFKEFMDRSRLTDVKLSGRIFTWYKSNGSCKSRIDRALVNEKWLEHWQGTTLRGLSRSTSDHCAIILSTKEED